MKRFVLKTDSWHYRYLEFSTDRRVKYRYNDLCSYVRALTWYFILHLITLVIGIFLSFGVGTAILNPEIVRHFLWNSWILTILALSLTGVLALILCTGTILLLTVGIGLSCIWVKENLQSTKEGPGSSPGFIRLAWRGIKNKTCVRIDFD